MTRSPPGRFAQAAGGSRSQVQQFPVRGCFHSLLCLHCFHRSTHSESEGFVRSCPTAFLPFCRKLLLTECPACILQTRVPRRLLHWWRWPICNRKNGTATLFEPSDLWDRRPYRGDTVLRRRLVRSTPLEES